MSPPHPAEPAEVVRSWSRPPGRGRQPARKPSSGPPPRAGALQGPLQKPQPRETAGLSDVLTRLVATRAGWKLLGLGAGSAARTANSHAATIYMVAHGELCLNTSTHRREMLSCGDVAILLPGAPHRIQAVDCGIVDQLVTLEQDAPQDAPVVARLGSGPLLAEVLIGQLTLEWPAELLPRAALPPLLVMRGSERSEIGSVEVLLSHISAAATGAGGSAYMTKLAEILIIKALRLHAMRGGQLLAGRQPTPDRKFERVVRLINENISHPWTVADLAQSVGMSRSTFAAGFSRFAGQSPIDHLMEQRLQRAAQLLANPSRSIADVSNSVGYQSAPAFTRRFTRRFGMSPGAFQRASCADAAMAG